MSNTSYAFISAFLKAGEARGMTLAHISRLSRTPTIQDVLLAIGGTEIGDYLMEPAVDTFDELDENLWGYLGHCVGRIEALRFIPDDVTKVLRAYLKKYDVYNVKAALHQLYSGQRTKKIPLGVICHYGMLDKLSGADTLDAIIEVLRNCGLTDYVPIVQEYRIEDGARSSLTTGCSLDAMYYTELLKISNKMKDSHILTKTFGLIIDMTNLLIVLRAIIAGMGTEAAGSMIPNGYLLSSSEARELLSAKLADLPSRLTNPTYREIADEATVNYSRNHEIASISETIDKHRLTLVKGLLSPRVMSPLSMVWYLFLKETEIRNLRLVMKAVFDDRPIDEIRDHLVFAS